jgi:hypothetical protein
MLDAKAESISSDKMSLNTSASFFAIGTNGPTPRAGIVAFSNGHGAVIIRIGSVDIDVRTDFPNDMRGYAAKSYSSKRLAYALVSYEEAPAFARASGLVQGGDSNPLRELSAFSNLFG